MTRLIMTCIAGIILGIAAISLPLAITYQNNLEKQIQPAGAGIEAANDATYDAHIDNPPWNAALNLSLITTLALALASSTLIILKHHTKQTT